MSAANKWQSFSLGSRPLALSGRHLCAFDPAATNPGPGEKTRSTGFRRPICMAHKKEPRARRGRSRGLGSFFTQASSRSPSAGGLGFPISESAINSA